MKPSNRTKPMPARAGAAVAAGILTATCFSNTGNSITIAVSPRNRPAGVLISC